MSLEIAFVMIILYSSGFIMYILRNFYLKSILDLIDINKHLA